MMYNRKESERLYVFVQGFSVLVNSGVSLVRSLLILEQDNSDPRWRQGISEVRVDLEQGATLSRSMSKHADLFASLLVAMVRAGEINGVLDVTLQRYAEYLRKELELYASCPGEGINHFQELALWCTRLGMLLQFAVPMLPSLEVSVEPPTRQDLREAVLILRERVREGELLSKGMADFRQIFPESVQSLFFIGEQTGKQDAMALHLAEYLETASPLHQETATDGTPEDQQNPAGPVAKLGAEPWGTVLADAGFAHPRQAAIARAMQMGVPFVDLSMITPGEDAIRLLPGEVCRRLNAIPVRRQENRLLVAMQNPDDATAVEEITAACGLDVQFALALPEQMKATLDRYYQGEENAALSLVATETAESTDETAEGMGETEAHSRQESEPPASERVSSLVKRAIQDGASDLILNPISGGLEVRLRVEGELRIGEEIPAPESLALVSRFKIAAELNMAENRLPQHAQIPVRSDEGRDYLLQVSTYPFVDGEGITVRILDRQKSRNSTLLDLGMAERDRQECLRLLGSPHGILAVAGEISGPRSRVLYAMLCELRLLGKLEVQSVVSMEDPVEDEIPDAVQIQLNPGAGLTMPAAIRALTQQDPDIMLVSEINDAATMNEVERAASLGHLLLVGVNGRDAANTLQYLVELGSDLIAAELIGVVGHRLLPRRCAECQGHGCSACGGTGNRGCKGVFEVLPTDSPSMRRLLHAGASLDEIQSFLQAH